MHQPTLLWMVNKGRLSIIYSRARSCIGRLVSRYVVAGAARGDGEGHRRQVDHTRSPLQCHRGPPINCPSGASRGHDSIKAPPARAPLQFTSSQRARRPPFRTRPLPTTGECIRDDHLFICVCYLR